MSTSGLQPLDSVVAVTKPQPAGDANESEIWACWNEIGVHGNATCPELKKVIRCRNCPVYSKAGVQLLDRPLAAGYRRAWTDHFAREKEPPGPAKASALLFRLNTEWLALPAQAFQEVADRRLVHSLPHRRDGVVLGLANIRGELLICISLGHLLGSAGVRPHHTLRAICERLLVVSWDRHRYAFPADEVRGIHRFSRQELQEVPATLSKSKLSYTQGILSWQGCTVGLLDPELLFSALNQRLT
jgi:chemotaxis-related protein WspD